MTFSEFVDYFKYEKTKNVKNSNLDRLYKNSNKSFDLFKYPTIRHKFIFLCIISFLRKFHLLS